jgi:hypothetical protein
MYHCDPETALEELREDALLLNPVHLRDMILRTQLSPEQALEMNRGLEEYLRRFGELQNLVRPMLQELARLQGGTGFQPVRT